jgi:hypothetical protein
VALPVKPVEEISKVVPTIEDLSNFVKPIEETKSVAPTET